MEYNISTRKKDKGWQVIVSYKDNGKWKQRSKQGFSTQREARLYGNDLVDEIRDKVSLKTPEEYKDITVEGFIDIFTQDKSAKVQTGTLNLIEFHLKKLKPIYKKKMSDVNYVDISNIVNDMQETLSPQSVKRYFETIKEFFQSAVRPYRINHENITEDISLNIQYDKTVKALGQEELSSLVKSMKGNIETDRDYMYYVMTSIAGYTGLRIGEVLGLTYSDIDLKNNKIKINKQFNLKNDGTYGLKKTKTISSNRELYFPNILKNIIVQFYSDIPLSTEGRLFYRINSMANISTQIADVYRSLGYDMTFHALRHSYATIMLSQGVDIKTVAALLGDTVNTIMNTYIHYTDEMRENAKHQIENIF